MPRPRISFVLALLFLTAALRADPVHEIEPAIRGFFQAYVSGDVSAAAGYWLEGALPKTMIAAMRVRCMQLESLRLASVRVEGDEAVADVESTIVAESAVETPHPRWETDRASFMLRRTAGAWKIVSSTRPEDAFMARFETLGELGRAAMLPTMPRTPIMVMRLAEQAIAEINRSEPARARLMLALALEIAAENPADHAATATAFAAESVVLLREEDHGGSIRTATEALRHAEASGDADAIARSLLRMGRANGEFTAESRSLFRRVLSLADRVVDVSVIAQAATRLAISRSQYGGFREEMEYALLATKYAEQSGDPTALLSASLNVGGVYYAQADLELAAVHYERAAVLARSLRYPVTEATILQRLAFCRGILGDDAAAMALRERSLALAYGAACFRKAAVTVLTEKAERLLYRGELVAAEREAAAALAEAYAFGSEIQIIAGRVIFAEIALRQGRYERALEFAGQDESIAAHLVSAQALHALGRLGEARVRIETALAMVESSRESLFGTERQHALYLERYADLFTTLMDILIDLGRIEEAHATSRRMKARVLREVLARDRSSGVLSETSDQQEQRLTREITELNTALIAAGEPQRIAAIREELSHLRTQLVDVTTRTRGSQSAHPVIEPDQAAAPIELRGALEQAVVLDYVVGRNRTTIFVIRNEGGRTKVTSHILAIDRDSLATRVRELRSAIEQRDLKVDSRARSLYQLLLGPVEDQIRGRPLICVIPSGALWNVAFQALPDRRGRYLIEKSAVLYSSSIALLEAAHQTAGGPSKEPTLLAFANPHIRAATATQFRSLHQRAILGAIPETETEVRALGRLYGPRRSQIHVGVDARESVLKREATSFDVLHVAAHGLIDDGAPMFSALVLSTGPGDEHEDGLLEAREIAALQLKTRIAVLSACETGRGWIAGGEGVIGLSWALLAAGCPTAVVSQWKVASASTARLMVAFHRNIVNGTSAANALRNAQLTLLRDREYSHPFYWAPFVVVGAP